MNRRAFLGALGAVAAGAVFDPEMLLWKPGAKTIFLPSVVAAPLYPDVSRFATFITPTWVTRDVIEHWNNSVRGLSAFEVGDTSTIEGVYV